METDWSNLFKVRLKNNFSKSFDKHEIIKLMIVRKLLRKHTKRNMIRIYTEHNLNNGSHLIPDIFFQDLKTKSVLCYEIQKECPPSYIRKQIEKYEKYEVPYMKTIDLIVIPLKEAPDNIIELNLWLEKYIF